MKRVMLIFLLGFLGWQPLSLAKTTKVELIQELMQEECHKKISYESALALIRPLYLTCVPGTKVSIGTKCELNCLKANSGVVIGR